MKGESRCYRDRIRDPRLIRRVEGVPLGEDTLSQGIGWVLAPTLGNFVCWTLHRALEKGLNRLYFVARDGWFPYRMARFLGQRWNLPVECRYLYGSRYAWRQPLFFLNHLQAVEHLCRSSLWVTPDRVLARGGLSEEERVTLLSQLGWEGDLPLSRKELGTLREQLLDCPEFFSLLDAHSREAFPLAGAYLRQEGLWDPLAWALVDSGWMGTLQDTLGALLEELGWKGRVRGLYWGLYRAPLQGDWDCCYFSPGRNLNRQANFQNCLFEGAFSAPHGMTLGYVREGERSVPVLGQPNGARSFLAREEEIFSAYGEALAREGMPTKEVLVREQREVQRLLGQWMTRPTREEALAFGRLAFTDDVLEGRSFSLASPLTRQQLAQNRVMHRLVGEKPALPSPWPEGSAALYGTQEDLRALGRLRWARTLGMALKAWRSEARGGGEP